MVKQQTCIKQNYKIIYNNESGLHSFVTYLTIYWLIYIFDYF